MYLDIPMRGDISNARRKLTDPNFSQRLNNLNVCCAEVRIYVKTDLRKLAYRAKEVCKDLEGS